MNYFLCGTETYNLSRRRNELIDQNADDDLNVNLFDATSEAEEVVAACMMAPFLASSKVVVWENPEFLTAPKDKNEKDFQKLTEYLNNPNYETTFILYCDGNIDKRRSAFTTLTRLLSYESFDQLTPDQFRSQVMRDLNDRHIFMNMAAQNELLERLPVDLENWKSELAKLELYPGELNEQAIKLLISRELSEDVLALSNAVVNRKMGRAVQIYRDLLVNNKNDIPSFIGLLAYQFRFMSQVMSLQEEHYLPSQIAKHYNCKEYRVIKTLEACGTASSDELMAILDRLATLDQKIKSGLIEPQLGLELFIIEVTRN